MITVKKLNKIYHHQGHDFHVLQDLDLFVGKGEMVGIIGRSGAGKSTLLRCINLLECPSSGQVMVDDVELTFLDMGALRAQREKIGMIFQYFNLLHSRHAHGNIALPLELSGCKPSFIKRRVNELLDLVGLTHRATHFPKALSGGQKQRLAIARALATSPQVLLCDEATSALDPESTQDILNLLKQINREFNLSILLITHELDVVKQICDRSAVLEQGILIEENQTFELFANPKHQVTKKLVRQAMHIPTIQWQSNPNSITDPESLSLFIQLTFAGEDSDAPLISELVQRFNVRINLQYADITQVQNKSLGYAICQLTGSKSAVQAALEHVRTTSVKLEVLARA